MRAGRQCMASSLFIAGQSQDALHEMCFQLHAGRQCMASSLFIAGRFQDALVYLSSVKEYCQGEDAFAWNHGIALASLGRWDEAEEALSTLTRPEWRADPVFVGWLARCYIQTGE